MFAREYYANLPETVKLKDYFPVDVCLLVIERLNPKPVKCPLPEKAVYTAFFETTIAIVVWTDGITQMSIDANAISRYNYVELLPDIYTPYEHQLRPVYNDFLRRSREYYGIMIYASGILTAKTAELLESYASIYVVSPTTKKVYVNGFKIPLKPKNYTVYAKGCPVANVIYLNGYNISLIT